MFIFTKDLDELLKSTLDFAHSEAYDTSGKDHPTLENYNAYNNNQYSRKANELRASYRILYEENEKINYTHDKILKIDMKERTRYLIFRVLTAIGIAAVVLVTAWIAKEYGITLPLSGVRQISA